MFESNTFVHKDFFFFRSETPREWKDNFDVL